MTNHIISEWSIQEEKEFRMPFNWMGKEMYRELCDMFKFDHTNKWYILDLKSVLENETHKIL